MMDEPVVFVVDDDPGARESVAALLQSRGLEVETYRSAEEFLESFDRSRCGCVVADLRMKGMSGLELQQRLRAEQVSLPLLVLTGYGNVPTAVSVMKGGAVTFLEKPCPEDELWGSVRSALNRHRRQRQDEARQVELEARLARLTPQEYHVMREMIAGKPNKVIAAELGIGLRTVELRRANVLKKMEAGSVAELVRLNLGIDLYQEALV